MYGLVDLPAKAGSHAAGSHAQALVMEPVGPGTPRELPHPDLYSVWGWFLPEGGILINGRGRNNVWRFYLMDKSGHATPIGPDAMDHWAGQQVASGDGSMVAGFPSGQNDV